MNGERPSVALVVLDTLRKDAFDRHFGWVPGRRYERAYAPADFTTPVHGSLFTGRYPTEHGALAKSKHLSTGPTLAELLGERGYTTRAWTANPNVSPEYDFVDGFDEFRPVWLYDDFADVFDWHGHARAHADTPIAVMYATGVVRCLRSGHATLRSLRRGVEAKFDAVGADRTDKGAQSLVGALERASFDGPEFLFVNLMEAHTPYVAPPSYLPESPVEKPSIVDQCTDGVTDGDRLRAAYEACAAYLSDVYRDAFDRLSEAFDYVVTLSDHGHSFGEHGAWGHGYGVYPEVTHVPLCVSGPAVSDDRVSRTVSLLDVHRTVLDFSGCEDAASRGVDLLASPDREECLTEFHGLYTNRVETLRAAGFDDDAIRERDATRRGLAAAAEYYGFETPDGFVETGNAGAVDAPEARIDALVADLDPVDVPSRGEGDRDGVDPRLRRQLEDLGYL